MRSKVPTFSIDEARVREYADAVAHLGRYTRFGPEVLQVLADIKRKRALCRDAEEKFDRRLKSQSAATAEDPPGCRLLFLELSSLRQPKSAQSVSLHL